MREVELPDPTWMRARWAAFAAVRAALGWGDGCRATGSRWHYDDGGGNWADVVHVGAGRAVLLGHDHEHSETCHDGEPGTDLLAGAPDWWAPPVREAGEAGLRVGFAYGFEDGSWRRADHDADDGFDSLDPPFADEARCRELIDEFTRGHAADAAVDALIAADADVTEELVAAVVGPGSDAGAGAAAARGFLAA
ncbi:proteophosphoglycan 5 [Actinosynnema sp. NPDC059797]